MSPRTLRILTARLSEIMTLLYVLKLAPEIRRELENVPPGPESITRYVFEFNRGFCIYALGTCIAITFRPRCTYRDALEIAKLVNKISPSRAVEVGTGRGGILLILYKLSRPEGSIVSVSPSKRGEPGWYPYYRKVLYSKIMTSRAVMLIRGDVLSRRTLRKTSKFLGEKADVVVINEISQGKARRIIDTYINVLRPGGVLVVRGVETSPTLREVWNEVKSMYSSEKVGTGDIGLVYV